MLSASMAIPKKRDISRMTKISRWKGMVMKNAASAAMKTHHHHFGRSLECCMAMMPWTIAQTPRVMRPVIPSGSSRSRMMATKSTIISPITELETVATMPSMVAEEAGCAHRADQRQVAAGDDRDEGLGDVNDAERGIGADDGRQHRAGEPGERRAEGEGQHVDETAVHPEGGGDCRVLHGAAHDQPVAGEAPEGVDRAQQRHRDCHHHEAVDREPEGAHLDVAEGRGHALGLAARRSW